MRFERKQIAFEVIQDFFVSLSLTITALLVSKVELSLLLLVKETCFAWATNMIIGFAIPEKRIGERIAKKIRLNPFLSYMLVMLVIVLINVIGISLCVVLKNVGLRRSYFITWFGLLPSLLLVGYPAALIFAPITGAIVEKMFNRRSTGKLGGK